MTRRHFLDLRQGDRFRFVAGGPTYRRAENVGKGEEARARLERLQGDRWVHAGMQEYDGCMVIPIEDDDSREGDRP